GWGFDVWGTSGPLQSWIIEMFSGDKSTEARTQLAQQVGTRANELLATKLANVSVFERMSQLELLGRPLGRELCVSDLEKIVTPLVAHVAARAPGAGSREAPGAHHHDGAAILAGTNELALDGNLIAQLLFASWRDGGLT